MHFPLHIKIFLEEIFSKDSISGSWQVRDGRRGRSRALVVTNDISVFPMPSMPELIMFGMKSI